MRKICMNSNLQERPAARAILALTLATTLAAFGCTTNRIPGNGEPVMGSPGSLSTPTSAPTGSSSGGTTPPNMTSSYRGGTAEGIVVRSAPLRQSPTDAAAVIASQRRTIVLGTSAPGTPDRPYLTGGPANDLSLPRQMAVTVNSSINSIGSAAAITSGAGEIVGFNDATVAGAAVFPETGAIVTPTSAGIAVTPTAAASGTVALSPAGTVTTTNASGTTAATPTASALSVTPTVASATGGARAAGLRTVATTGVNANTVRITNADGRVTVTNVGATAGTTTSPATSRPQ